MVCRSLPGALSATCESFLELGGICSNPYECGSRFNFEISCIGGVCAKLLGNGATCDLLAYSDCASGFCNPETSRCEPLTLHKYCMNRSQEDTTFDMVFGRIYSRY
ncbi:MAG: hypothetical protein CVU59_09960 [Deltaproteobacteria bacterium HGW-Deltaproteobacteria-17]|nr:MAG: hypothetical protein CVU59_09960 [Deltaproteobacteria bacterium HGW-Deltaproteobacteria-17]